LRPELLELRGGDDGGFTILMGGLCESSGFPSALLSSDCVSPVMEGETGGGNIRSKQLPSQARRCRVVSPGNLPKSDD